MTKKLIVLAALLGAALALPGVASAAPPAPPPAQDSVTFTDGPAAFDDNWSLITLEATSGPSGENPTGQVTLRLGPPFNITDGGPVTCLAVSGNSAIINYQSNPILQGRIRTISVVDGNPDTISGGPFFRAPDDCSPFTQFQIDPLIGGNITVVDAQPLPTTRGQCFNGGWAQHGFQNQGLCLAFVERRPQG